MKRELQLRQRLQSLSTLGEAVGAMKSLSAHHFRQAREAVGPARVYREGVERALGRTGAVLAAGDGPAGLLVIGGELGLCGAYNARLAEAAAQRRAELGVGPTFCVGRRATRLLGRRNIPMDANYAGPTSVRGITGLLLRLAEDVLTIYARERLCSVDIVSSPFAGVGISVPTSVQLLPLLPKGSPRADSARYVSAEHLASAAIREFLYITLHGLLLDALASEHGARLVATEGAEKWLQARTDRVRRHLAAARREVGTQEVIEIALGARATRAHAG